MDNGERITTTELARELRAFVAEEREARKELKTQMQEIVDAMQELELTEAGRRHLIEQIPTMRKTLYGDPDTGAPGHEQRLVSLEKQSAITNKVMWIIITPALTGIGFGIIYLIAKMVELTGG